ncbi:hypothetical protein Pelo_18747 [Pelomyxa schiedti]|nr:hypothetical protein Pelo_18747 [Pelomyxa schiedti]
MEGDARYRCPLCKKFKKLGWISDYTSRRVAVNGMCQHLKWHMTKHKKRLAKHHAPHQHDSAEPSLIDKALRLRANIMIPMQLDMPYMCAWCQGHLTPLGWQQHGPVRECAIEVTHSTAPDQESEGTPPKLQWADIRTQCLSPLLIDVCTLDFRTK